MHFLIRLLVNAAALWAAAQFVRGVTFQGDGIRFIFVALLFGVVNAFIRPVAKLLALPLILITLGLFTFVVNALMLLLTSSLSTSMGLGFHVSGFGAAFFGALVVSLVSTLLSIAVKESAWERWAH